VRGHLQGSGYLDDKNQLQTWHDQLTNVTYTDDIETTGVTVKIVEFSYDLVPGWTERIIVDLTLIEAQ